MKSPEALIHIQARLRTDGHAELLQKIPARLFKHYNGNIVLDLPKLCDCDLGYSPIFAFILSGMLHVNVSSSSSWQRLMASNTCLELVYRVPPFVYLPLELLQSVECERNVLALLEYYLLVCVVENKYGGGVPIPLYKELEGACRVLERVEIYWPEKVPRINPPGFLGIGYLRECDERHEYAVKCREEEDDGRKSVARSLFEDDETAVDSGVYESEAGGSCVDDETVVEEEDHEDGSDGPAERHYNSLRLTSFEDEQEPEEALESDDHLPQPLCPHGSSHVRYPRHESDTDASSRRYDTLSPSLPPEQVTPRTSEAHYKSIETVVTEGFYSPKHNSTTYHQNDNQRESEYENTPDNTDSEHMADTTTLQKLRKAIGQRLFSHLPGISRLDWRKDATDPAYLPLALRIGLFKARSDFPDCWAWAYFKTESTTRIEIFVTQDEEGDAYIEGGAQVSLGYHYKDIAFDDEFADCTGSTDIAVLTKYFFLCAAEMRDQWRYGLFEPQFPCDKMFRERMERICARCAESAEETGEQEDVEMQDDEDDEDDKEMSFHDGTSTISSHSAAQDVSSSPHSTPQVDAAPTTLFEMGWADASRAHQERHNSEATTVRRSDGNNIPADNDSDSEQDIPHARPDLIHVSETSYNAAMANIAALRELQRQNVTEALEGQQTSLAISKANRKEAQRRKRRLEDREAEATSAGELDNFRRRRQGVEMRLKMIEGRIDVAERAVEAFKERKRVFEREFGEGGGEGE
ncbi:hypothetical protein CC86DRAFT_426715 [Ophiobolus disseminans]|uniref:Uncharacterized protein n=1 Tax=Ophiobolus disseminans TaxID=1469910 RepID=A0A6A6ZKF1_9PLEO|nr:hypothetical protein CC86DRAFT_426715 [Ophiobolus disseminans]